MIDLSVDFNSIRNLHESMIEETPKPTPAKEIEKLESNLTEDAKSKDDEKGSEKYQLDESDKSIVNFETKGIFRIWMNC